MHILCGVRPTCVERHLPKLWRQFRAETDSPAGNVTEESCLN